MAVFKLAFHRLLPKIKIEFEKDYQPPGNDGNLIKTTPGFQLNNKS
jgi:hypothetical protein